MHHTHLNSHEEVPGLPAGNAAFTDPAADHTDALYVGTSGYGVFKSADGGATWAPFNDGLTHLDAPVLAVTRGRSSTVYAGTPGGVFKIVRPSVERSLDALSF